jgi:hypothetical protein
MARSLRFHVLKVARAARLFNSVARIWISANPVTVPDRFIDNLNFSQVLVPQTGFEPVTPSLRMTCSTS